MQKRTPTFSPSMSRFLRSFLITILSRPSAACTTLCQMALDSSFSSSIGRMLLSILGRHFSRKSVFVAWDEGWTCLHGLKASKISWLETLSPFRTKASPGAVDWELISRRGACVEMEKNAWKEQVKPSMTDCQPRWHHKWKTSFDLKNFQRKEPAKITI